MAQDQTRRNFFRTAPLAAAAVSIALTDRSLFAAKAAPGAAPAIAPRAAQAAAAGSQQPFQVFSAQSIESMLQELQTAPGAKTLIGTKTSPFTIVETVEKQKSAKEFEYHEHRDHIFQIIDGTTLYELGGTPQKAHSTGPGEWLAPVSEGSTSVTLHKGDTLVIPRGTPHKRSTAESVTFTLISIQG